MTTAKYEFTGETKFSFGILLRRIRAVRTFGLVAAGTLGGWLGAGADHLAHDGNAWVSGDAQVSGRLITASRSDGYIFTIVPVAGGFRIQAGCRNFTFQEAREHWARTRAGTPLGSESLALVDHLERMSQIEGCVK